jgi:hypothetical protein
MEAGKTMNYKGLRRNGWDLIQIVFAYLLTVTVQNHENPQHAQ